MSESKNEPYGYAFQHEETGLQQVVDAQQVEWGFEKNNPRWQNIGAVYPASAIAAKDEEIAKLREATERLADKIEDLIYEFGDDPKAALHCVSEYLQLRRFPMQEEC